MNSGIYYQVLINLNRESASHHYPSFLQDVMRSGNLSNIGEFLDFLGAEMVQAQLGTPSQIEYFTFLADQGMNFFLYRKDFEAFYQAFEIVQRKFDSLGENGSKDSDINQWKQYFTYLKLAADRLSRKISSEDFENEIMDLDWASFNKVFVNKLSGLAGHVYLNEEQSDDRTKGKFWLQKAVNESDGINGLVHLIDLVSHLLSVGDESTLASVGTLIDQLENTAGSIGDLAISKLSKTAVFELKTKFMLLKMGVPSREEQKFESVLDFVKEQEYEMKREAREGRLPEFARAFLMETFGRKYLEIHASNRWEEKNNILQAHFTDSFAIAAEIAGEVQDEVLKHDFQLKFLESGAVVDKNITEKEFRDNIAFWKKGGNLPSLVRATNAFSTYFLASEQNQKAFDILVDLVKGGQRELENGGLDLVVAGMEGINEVLKAEILNPGVTWIVESILTYFTRVTDIIVELDAMAETMSTSIFDRFREAFIQLEPASKFNILVYHRYQYVSIQVLRLSGLVKEDELTVKLADQSLKNLSDESNPMSFIKAEWEDFKDVPNSVRNKVINQCITISKGDLPAAAEHLDFSYRNLRSYITFNEVNRLGNFLDIRQTKNRQLEEGIRLSFHDLYKSGTIFEVVFDMPKFLVDTADDGFCSLDMETSLNIKGTTAKKYIKIMMEIDLIEYEKSVGRKHYYRLRKDIVMNRLAKNQVVLTN